MTNKITIVNSDDAEEAEYVICLPLNAEHPMMFPDNETGICCKCKQPIQYRPNAPKKPPKACIYCMLPEMEKQAEENALDIRVSERSMASLQSKNETKH